MSEHVSVPTGGFRTGRYGVPVQACIFATGYIHQSTGPILHFLADQESRNRLDRFEPSHDAREQCFLFGRVEVAGGLLDLPTTAAGVAGAVEGGVGELPESRAVGTGDHVTRPTRRSESYRASTISRLWITMDGETTTCTDAGTPSETQRVRACGCARSRPAQVRFRWDP